MTPLASPARRLLLLASAFAAVLFLTGELHWGSGALIAFSGLWLFQFGREAVRLRRERGARPS
jgi:hypothetical protein